MQKKNNWLSWLKAIAWIAAIWILGHIVYLCIDGIRNFKGKADVAIVLGNRVFAGGRLSPWLQGRVDEALALYQSGQVKKIFVSGGLPVEGGSEFPEGDAMKAYLLQHGVPDSAVIADNYGQNTYLTAKNFLDWNKAQHYSSAVVVSQFYHITRTKYILRRLGFKEVYSAASKQYSWRDVPGTVREVPAFYKYLWLYR